LRAKKGEIPTFPYLGRSLVISSLVFYCDNMRKTLTMSAGLKKEQGSKTKLFEIPIFTHVFSVGRWKYRRIPMCSQHLR